MIFRDLNPRILHNMKSWVDDIDILIVKIVRQVRMH